MSAVNVPASVNTVDAGDFKVESLLDKAAKIQIGGIKFSVELAHITIIRTPEGNCVSGELLRLIAEKGINIPFLCYSAADHQQKTSFCIEVKDFDIVQEILSSATSGAGVISVLPSVGTCTLFPHRYSLGFLAQILAVTEQHNFPLYSLSTSISAVALNTDFHLLDDLADKLLEIMKLPKNHAPFRQEFQLKQVNP